MQQMTVSTADGTLFLQRVMAYAENHDMFTDDEKIEMLEQGKVLGARVCKHLKANQVDMGAAVQAQRFARTFLSIGLEIEFGKDLRGAVRKLKTSPLLDSYKLCEERIIDLLRARKKYMSQITGYVYVKAWGIERDVVYISHAASNKLSGLFSNYAIPGGLGETASKYAGRTQAFGTIDSFQSLMRVETVVQRAVDEFEVSQAHMPWDDLFRQCGLERQAHEHRGNLSEVLDNSGIHLGSMLLTMAVGLLTKQEATPAIPWEELKAFIPRIMEDNFVDDAVAVLRTHLQQSDTQPTAQEIDTLMLAFTDTCDDMYTCFPHEETRFEMQSWMYKVHLLAQPEEFKVAQIRFIMDASEFEDQDSIHVNQIGGSIPEPKSLEDAKFIIDRFDWSCVYDPDELHRLIKRMDLQYIIQLMPLDPKLINAFAKLWGTVIDTDDAKKIIRRIFAEADTDICNELSQDGMSSIVQHMDASMIPTMLMASDFVFLMIKDWHNSGHSITMKEVDRHALIQRMIDDGNDELWDLVCIGTNELMKIGRHATDEQITQVEKIIGQKVPLDCRGIDVW